MTIQMGTHIVHTVQPGDTVYSLAVRYESDVNAIVQANGIYPPFTDPYVIYQGQILVIPRLFVDPTETLYIVQPGDNLMAIAQRFSSDATLIAGTNANVQNPNVIFPNQQIRIPAFTYVVQVGDSLFSISQRTGITLEDILVANSYRPSISPDLIYEGIKLLIPIPVSQNIVVYQPLPGSTIRDNETIKGYARAFEANVLYRLIDGNDVEVIEETFTTAEFAGPNYGRFRDSLSFDTEPTSTEGELQVYTRSAKDGSIQDLVQIKVFFPQ
ncbi:LysM peptidoglycan-binding domain-containing protein [Salipaludibacillus daqingensis]|uniref:LysM peptidoglycan-binding domain-containing protein n=1 Tax=Salipaludibacillus daqingensis TaxID=3041001 RepID=UPI00247672E9|nr:LysM peptidoglycan-binding domain-containing protein [Salipaludibacillus daqingensis]